MFERIFMDIIKLLPKFFIGVNIKIVKSELPKAKFQTSIMPWGSMEPLLHAVSLRQEQRLLATHGFKIINNLPCTRAFYSMNYFGNRPIPETFSYQTLSIDGRGHLKSRTY